MYAFYKFQIKKKNYLTVFLYTFPDLKYLTCYNISFRKQILTDDETWILYNMKRKSS